MCYYVKCNYTWNLIKGKNMDNIALYSVFVQYYSVLCTMSMCSVSVQYYNVHIPLAECTTNLSQQDLKSSNYHKIDNNNHKKELRKTNFNKLLRRCERDSNLWIDCINWNRKGKGEEVKFTTKFSWNISKHFYNFNILVFFTKIK